MIVKIELEVSDEVTTGEVHEWLCLTIHEGDVKALEALQDAVVNITDTTEG